MKISVIVPAYNEEKYLDSALKKINLAGENLGTQIGVIVIDNESSDETASIASSARASVVAELE